MYHLSVRTAFGRYKVGDIIDDPAEVNAHMDSPFVVRVWVNDPPAKPAATAPVTIGRRGGGGGGGNPPSAA